MIPLQSGRGPVAIAVTATLGRSGVVAFACRCWATSAGPRLRKSCCGDLQGSARQPGPSPTRASLRASQAGDGHEGGLKLGTGRTRGLSLSGRLDRGGVPRESRRTSANRRGHAANEDSGRHRRQRSHSKSSLTLQGRPTEDVTPWARSRVRRRTAARCVNSDGEVTALCRGQHTLMVRFLGEVAAPSVTVPFHADERSIPGRIGSRTNFIDGHRQRNV